MMNSTLLVDEAEITLWRDGMVNVGDITLEASRTFMVGPWDVSVKPQAT